MALLTKSDPLTRLIEDVRKATATLDGAKTQLVSAGHGLMRTTAAAAAMARGDRRGRTSCESHVTRELERGGPCDLEKFERDLDERPWLFSCCIRALHTIEKKRIGGDGHYRCGTTSDEAALIRDVCEYSSTDEVGLRDELSRSQRNVRHLVALGYLRTGRTGPKLFGVLTYQDEAAEIENVSALIAKVAAQFRQSPVLMQSACEAFSVEQRPGVDSWPSLLDAAVAEHQRRQR